MYIEIDEWYTYIKYSDDDIAFIKQARHQDKSHVDIIHKILDYIQEKLNIIIEIDTLPSKFHATGRKGAGWYGMIRGKILNSDGTEHQSLCLNNIFHTWTSHHHEENYQYVCEVDTGGGSSGAYFAMAQSCIKLSSFPTLEKKVEHNTITEQTQKDFDRVLANIALDVREKREKYTNEEIKNNFMHQELEDAIDKCQTFLSELMEQKSIIEENIKNEAEEKITYVLPEVKNAFMNLSIYQKTLSSMKFKKSKKVPQFECIEKFNQYILKNAERFL